MASFHWLRTWNHCWHAMYRRGDRFDQLMKDLPGGITTKEGAFLRRLASGISNGCIVEVGSFQGKSAVALDYGVRDQVHDGGCAVYCIEPHRPFTGFYGGKFGPSDRGAFYKTMCTTGAFNNIALINQSSEQVTPGWNKPVGLLFIDGDHRYEAVKRDFNCWDPHVVLDGIVAFDDALDPACGPYKVIDEVMRSGCYKRLETVGKIVALRKTSVAAANSSRLPGARQRILVPCHSLVLTGGLLRFDRVGKVLRDWGHPWEAKAVANATFQKMRAVEHSGEFPFPWLRPRNDSPKVRRGKVGGFKDTLCAEDVDYLNFVFRIPC